MTQKIIVKNLFLEKRLILQLKQIYINFCYYALIKKYKKKPDKIYIYSLLIQQLL